MDSLAAAIFTAAIALLAKIALDLWNRGHERRAIAGALAGEIGAYESFFDQDVATNYRKIASLPLADRRQVLSGFPPLPLGHPVFDKVAGRLGLLSTSQAREVSRIYNIVTGTRLVITNFSSEKFLQAPDNYQKGILEFIAKTIDTEMPRARLLVTDLDLASRKSWWSSLSDALRVSHSSGSRNE
jgi:hypothetical protein